MTRVECTACGHEFIESEKPGLFCPECGTALSPQEKAPAEKMTRENGVSSGNMVRHKLEFRGTASEYFRIFIVNIFLTIITFGIYAARAKVRTRRYFYSHSLLAGEPFDYRANPLAILRGYLIVGGGFIIYQLSGRFYPLLTTPIIMAFFMIFPFLMYKSLRFKAHNSAWRNIRFRFSGKLKSSYFVFLVLPVLSSFTLGILFPYFRFRQKKYFLGNMAFGATKNDYSGRPGPFYKYMLMSILLVVLGFGVLIVVLRILILIFAADTPGVPNSPASSSEGSIFGALLSLLLMFSIFIFIQPYVYVRLTNYSWKSSRLGEVRFESTLTVHEMLWIRLTNIMAMFISLGLLVPWAKVRRMRYVMDNLVIVTSQSLDEFTAAVEAEESAIGDSAMDFFDFEIGL